MARVVDLLEVHVTIERALVAARMAAMAGDPVVAPWLGRLELLLRLHIGHEEELLLPIWEQADAPPNCTAAVLRDEHRKILRLLGEARAGEPFVRLGRLGAVLEHHDAREAGAFKPGLDLLLDEADRARILARIAAEMVLPPEPPLPTPVSRRAPLPSDDGTLRGAIAVARAALATDQAPDLDVIEARLPAGAKLRRVLGHAREALRGEGADAVTRRLARMAAYDRLRLLDPILDV